MKMNNICTEEKNAIFGIKKDKKFVQNRKFRLGQ